jgi:hypothetical protein
MNEIPEEYELMSFFEVEPKKRDVEVPFYYNNLTYNIINGSETIDITISPSFADIEIFWIQNNLLKFNWKLNNIKTLKIEKNDGIECMKIIFNSENMSDCLLWIKPHFKIIGGMNIVP